MTDSSSVGDSNVLEAVQARGFSSAAEFFNMVAAVDLSSVEKIINFNHWKNTDGSKAGLEKLLVLK